MTSPAINDGRRSRRYLVSKQANIIVGSKSYAEVQILDLSATGAHLLASQKVDLPAKCDLLVGAEQLRYPIQIVWQRGVEIGVTFVGEPEFSDASETSN